MNTAVVEARDKTATRTLTLVCESLDPLGPSDEIKLFWKNQAALPVTINGAEITSSTEYKDLLDLHDLKCKAPDHNLKIQLG